MMHTSIDILYIIGIEYKLKFPNTSVFNYVY